ncbi:DUF3040 domain-containing protein [Actinokineospora sp. NBRC 105648]|uniref:DUF3040 domain-containing protein n=1 Tax=Actinokineospora sp. NBRC 105648 TaxID=3032206 RepID=UPI0024A15FFF|nr:DUF3040 domain-containing protein [Actinokineospora sp. NBRC 105648]GLZ42255.1 hypothetical protein Acsp05_58790 [Actinokineospora sp. NBRC 105648]
MELSRREQEILAQIEGELTDKAKTLAATLNTGPVWRLRYSSLVRTGLGLAGLLVLGLVVVIVLGVQLLELGPLGLCILTAIVVVPWFVLACARVNHSEADD